MKVGRSRTGLPTIRESGGGTTNKGDAVVICGPNGEKLRPLFTPKGLCNGDHAIFVAKPGMHIVQASHSRLGEYTTVSKIIKIGTPEDKDEIVMEEIAVLEDGDGNIPEKFRAAVNSTLEKAYCYHCREVHYAAY